MKTSRIGLLPFFILSEGGGKSDFGHLRAASCHVEDEEEDEGDEVAATAEDRSDGLPDLYNLGGGYAAEIWGPTLHKLHDP